MTGTRPARTPAKGSGAASRRFAARLAAVQALYEIDMTAAPLDTVLGEFIRRRWGDADLSDGDGVTLPEPDGDFFGALVRGTAGDLARLDGMIESALEGGWTVARLEAVLRATLRVGAYELSAMQDVPAQVVISEYVDLAADFFAGGEPGLVNGVLDRLAKTLRSDEVNGTGRGGA